MADTTKTKAVEMADTTMRITTGGNVAAYAAHALKFLETNPYIILTTRPPLSAPAPSESSKGLHQATLATPRLISVVEKIKREHGGKLWQYTESGLLEPVGIQRPSLERVLGGRTKPKMTHQPYLQITLATRPLGLEKGRNVTLQKIEPKPTPKLKAKASGKEKQKENDKEKEKSKGATGRTAGRGEHAAEPTTEAGEADGMDVDVDAGGEGAAERRAKRKSQVDDGPSKRVRK